MKKTAVYRYYGQDGELLYVGLSHNPFTRAKQHGFLKDENVSRLDLKWFDTRDEAISEESIAIQLECPIWNEKEEVIHFHKWMFYAFANKQYPFNDRPIEEVRCIIANIRKGCVARGWLSPVDA